MRERVENESRRNDTWTWIDLVDHVTDQTALRDVAFIERWNGKRNDDFFDFTQSVGMDQRKRRPICPHQSPHRRTDTRKRAADRPPSAAALFSRNAERNQSHDLARGAARTRTHGRG